MNRQASLPAFIEPMLAKPGTPFDSDEYLFELKWDGTRALAFIDDDGVRLINRRERNINERYPDLIAALKPAPAGCVLDGEIVVMRDGKPDFQSLQKREQARTEQRIQLAVRSHPATYVAFDQLYDQYNSVMNLPCSQRRELARQTVVGLNAACVVMSEGITGQGMDYFARTEALGLEGIIAKRLDAPYLPGKRTDHWIKIKRDLTVPCVIIGYETDEKGQLRNLSLAAHYNGKFQYVGHVGSGIDLTMNDQLLAMLKPRQRATPVVPVKEKAIWVEPELYCLVRCMEQTRSGHLRAPVFVKLYEP